MKTMTIEWFDTKNETKSLFNEIRKYIDVEKINIDNALNGTHLDFILNGADRFFPVDGSIIISDYLKNYEELFELDAVLADDMVLSMGKLKTPIISMASNPYGSIAQNMQTKGLWRKDQYFRDGIFFAEMQKMQYDKSQKVVCSSEDMANYVKQIGYKGETVTLEYAPDTEYWSNPFGENAKQNLKTELGVPLEKPIACAITRFDETANYSLLRKIVTGTPEVFWILMLEGTNPRPLKSKNVKIVEWADEEMRRKVFNTSNFYLTVNPWDYKNIYTLQAMSCELPIITPKVGYFNKKTMVDVLDGANSNTKIYDFGITIENPELTDYVASVKDLVASAYQGKRYEFRPKDHFDATDHSHDTYIYNLKNVVEDALKK